MNIDIDDSEDDRSHHQCKKVARHQQVPEHLRIPAEDVEIAVKLTKEILESNRKRKLNKDQGSRSGNNSNNRRSSLKKSEPEFTTIATTTKTATPKAKKTQNGTASPKKSPSSAGKANSGSTSTSADTPKRPTKAKQGKMSTKRCEACGATETPCWRPGYAPHSALCNSCGLRYKKASVFCPKEGCKYIPVKADYLLMEEERVKASRSYLICKMCSGPIALPVKKDSSKKD
ncbi:DNA-binding transcription repressor [Modicella reniformis]|uniref:DNA-binding transcription repressor n=1 Tax=Modicella reniformis TaxID=1440133 RepID=A0A9P6IS36_9FUNG|nr:DNA-binding transcription repressor [Modicella reniformis]